MARLPYEFPGWTPRTTSRKRSTGTTRTPRTTRSVPSRTTINRTQQQVREANITAAAIGSPLPIVYGQAAMAPLIFAVGKLGNDLVIGCAWCIGEIERVGNIYNGDALIAASWVKASYMGTTTQGVDPTLAAAITGYADTLVGTIRGVQYGVAYSVIQVPEGQDFPSSLRAVIHGRIADVTAHGRWVEVNALAGATASSTSYNGSHPPVLAIDGNTGTWWQTVQTRGELRYLLVTLPAAKALHRLELVWGPSYGHRRVWWDGHNYTDFYAERIPPINYQIQYYYGSSWVTFPGQHHVNNRNFTIRFSPSPNITTRYLLVRIVTSTPYVRGNTNWPYSSYNQITEVKAWTKEWQIYKNTSVANAVVALKDFIEDKINGFGVDVSSDGLQDAIDWADETMPDGQPRHPIGLALIRKDTVENHVDALRAYCDCWVAKTGDTVKIIPDRSVGITARLTEDVTVSGSVSIEQESITDVPTAVAVRYTDQSSWPWTTGEVVVYHPDVLSGQLELRTSTIDLPGIFNSAVARRKAIRRLNHFTLVRLHMSCVVFDEALHWSIGDVLSVSNAWGLVDKPMRIIERDIISEGRYRLQLEEYDEKVYSASIETTPGNEDNVIQSPDVVPAPRNLVFGQPDLDEPNDRMSFTVEWDFPHDQYPYSKDILYYVELLRTDGTVAWSIYTTDQDISVQDVPCVHYDVRVTASPTWHGITSTSNALTDTILAPSEVPDPDNIAMSFVLAAGYPKTECLDGNGTVVSTVTPPAQCPAGTIAREVRKGNIHVSWDTADVNYWYDIHWVVNLGSKNPSAPPWVSVTDPTAWIHEEASASTTMPWVSKNLYDAGLTLRAHLEPTVFWNGNTHRGTGVYHVENNLRDEPAP